MARMNAHDIMTVFFVLALIFTVGFHIGTEKDIPMQDERYVTVSLSKAAGTLELDESFMIDGRFSVDVIEINDSFATLLCRGNMCEAGFLVGGTKYISENQPLRVYSEVSYMEGRIFELSAR